MQDGATVRDVMSREFVGVSEGDTVADVAHLVLEERADCVVVLRGSEPVGVVTAHDVLEQYTEGSADDEAIERAMRPPPESIAVDSDLTAAVSRLSNEDVDQLPVVDRDDELVGLVTESDLVTVAASVLLDRRTTDAVDAHPAEHAEVSGVTEGGAGAPREPIDREYSEQGVCESCGSLAGNLQPVNGQIICPECRDV